MGRSGGELHNREIMVERYGRRLAVLVAIATLLLVLCQLPAASCTRLHHHRKKANDEAIMWNDSVMGDHGELHGNELHTKVALPQEIDSQEWWDKTFGGSVSKVESWEGGRMHRAQVHEHKSVQDMKEGERDYETGGSFQRRMSSGAPDDDNEEERNSATELEDTTGQLNSPSIFDIGLSGMSHWLDFLLPQPQRQTDTLPRRTLAQKTKKSPPPKRKSPPPSAEFCSKHPFMCKSPPGRPMVDPAPVSPSTVKANVIVTNIKNKVKFNTKAKIVYTLQDAVNLAPKLAYIRFVILLLPGTYTEKVIIPANRWFITIVGVDRSRTIVQWNDNAATLGPDGKPLMTNRTATLWAQGKGFRLQGVTIQNTAPRPPLSSKSGQAVALHISGDMAAIYDSRLVSWQDTLYAELGRQYYQNVLVEGTVDYIFGDAQAYFWKCTLYSRPTPPKDYGFVTAQKRSGPDYSTGFMFTECFVTGASRTYLGRPWGVYSRVFFFDCFMDSNVDPVGWTEWRGTKDTVSYAEVGSYGPGGSQDGRVSWLKKLPKSDILFYSSIDFLGPEKWVSRTPPLGVSLLPTPVTPSNVNLGNVLGPYQTPGETANPSGGNTDVNGSLPNTRPSLSVAETAGPYGQVGGVGVGL